MSFFQSWEAQGCPIYHSGAVVHLLGEKGTSVDQYSGDKSSHATALAVEFLLEKTLLMPEH